VSVTTNSDIATPWQPMDSDATVVAHIVTNSSAQPSVIVESSGVSSTFNDEGVQEVEAAYERIKAEVDEQ
jgi:hypothetical protein